MGGVDFIDPKGQDRMAQETGRPGLFDWLPWRGERPEPESGAEAVQILSMDPLVVLILVAALLAAGFTLYYRPRVFMRSFAETVGGTVGTIVGTIAGVGIVVAGAVVYFDAAGLSLLVIVAIVVAIVLFGFFVGGDV
jgi:hypothetical protein